MPLIPEVQFLHIETDFLSDRTRFLNSAYLVLFHIVLKESLVRSPMMNSASLSKQHGSTFPSQVMTGLSQRRRHPEGIEFRITYFPPAFSYLAYSFAEGIHFHES